MKKILHAKIHKARVTECNLEYEGSITIDEKLMAEVGIMEYESVLVANIENGERFETYVIQGECNSGRICVNGAAANKVKEGDRLIIMAFEFSQACPVNPKILIIQDTENKKYNRK